MIEHTIAQRADFLNLPVEIRVRIYRLCFITKEYPTDVDWIRFDFHTSRYLVRDFIWRIFQVCKQVYSEIMPEYYASTEFRFNAMIHLKEALAGHAILKAHVRHIVLNPHFTMPSAEELFKLRNLQSFTIANLTCREPLDTPPGMALSHATLKNVITGHGGRLSAQNQFNLAMQLHDGVKVMGRQQGRDIHLLLRFRYSYSEWNTTVQPPHRRPEKRNRMIDYDCTDDFFTLLQPDENEICLITV